VVQHDVQELNRVLFDAISSSLTGTDYGDLIQNLYKGLMVYQSICMTCNTTFERDEIFLDLSL
jgi:ubiquitin carboxyl-terminal hydrolase 40